MDIERVRRLYQAVVANCLLEAVAPDRGFSRNVLRRKADDDLKHEAHRQRVVASRYARANIVRTEAREWLLDGGDDFELITSLAGYNPDDIRERAMRLAERGWPKLVTDTLAA